MPPIATELAAAGPASPTPAAVEALKRFRAIFRSARHHLQDIEQRCGISGSQLWALSVVVERPGTRVKDLAQALAIQQSTASNLVEQLARQSLLRRERDRFDQRIVLLFPTEMGISTIERAPRPLAGILPNALSRLDPARLETLNLLLHEIAEGLREHGGEPRAGQGAGVAADLPEAVALVR